MTVAQTTAAEPRMAKKKKATLYVDIPEALKQRLERLAELRRRKLNAEAAIALERYCDEEEKREGISQQPGGEQP